MTHCSHHPASSWPSMVEKPWSPGWSKALFSWQLYRDVWLLFTSGIHVGSGRDAGVTLCLAAGGSWCNELTRLCELAGGQIRSGAAKEIL